MEYGIKIMPERVKGAIAGNGRRVFAAPCRTRNAQSRRPDFNYIEDSVNCLDFWAKKYTDIETASIPGKQELEELRALSIGPTMPPGNYPMPNPEGDDG